MMQQINQISHHAANNTNPKQSQTNYNDKITNGNSNNNNNTLTAVEGVWEYVSFLVKNLHKVSRHNSKNVNYIFITSTLKMYFTQLIPNCDSYY